MPDDAGHVARVLGVVDDGGVAVGGVAVVGLAAVDGVADENVIAVLSGLVVGQYDCCQAWRCCQSSCAARHDP